MLAIGLRGGLALQAGRSQAVAVLRRAAQRRARAGHPAQAGFLIRTEVVVGDSLFVIGACQIATMQLRPKVAVDLYLECEAIMMSGPLISALNENNEEFVNPPDDIFSSTPPFKNKRAMEFAHLQNFKRVIGIRMPHLLFRLIGDGTDPPDFFISRQNAKIGIELTSFALPKYRERTQFFSYFKDKVLKSYSLGKLQNLRGIEIKIVFESPNGKPNLIDDKTFDDFIEELECIDLYKYNINSLSDFSDEYIHKMAEISKPHKIKNIIWNIEAFSTQPAQGSLLANLTGFEITCDMRDWLPVKIIHEELNNLIHKKDKQYTDELLISAGAPDLKGRCFRAEAMLAMHAAENWQGLLRNPHHIKRVFLDIWGMDKIYLLHSVA